MVRVVGVVAGSAMVVLILWDAFDFAMLPQMLTRTRRFSRNLVRWAWALARALSGRLRPGGGREGLLSVAGPVAMVTVFASWALGLVTGFALVHWGVESPLHDPLTRPGPFDYFYFSGVTFFTLGYGDLVPVSRAGRLLALAEVGTGYSFLAIVISYFPVLSQAYAAREVEVVKLAVRSDTPPTAAALVLRAGPGPGLATLTRYLEEWETWAAESQQSHIAYPVLCYYRSQTHAHSWLAAMTAMLDTAALLLTVVETPERHAAQGLLTMLRTFTRELCEIHGLPPSPPRLDRLPPDTRAELLRRLRASGFTLDEGDDACRRLHNLRETYEPALAALGAYFLVELPPLLLDGSGTGA
jgi:hypothetical protein